MFRNSIHLVTAVALIGFGSLAHGQGAASPEPPPTPTLWRFLGIPQGFQKLRDVSVNRRGNFPGLERTPPMKQIADPANLESDDPAIKAAAEVKQAEDMKDQKVKAIKYLASIGCGCYDKDGKITEALIAATDDCTPDVRMAAIEAVEEAANGEQCQQCGSTSCCSEKVTERLSEIAYERDDTGCPIEPDAEIRAAAARALRVCCPGGPSMGPFEEGVPEEVPTPPEPIPGETPDDQPGIPGEVPEGSRSEGTNPESVEELPAADSEGEGAALGDPSGVELTPFELTQRGPVDVTIGDPKVIGGMRVQPVSLVPHGGEESPSPATSRQSESGSPSAPITTPAGPQRGQSSHREVAKPLVALARTAKVVSVNHRNGQVHLRAVGPGKFKSGASVVVYHEYLTGQRLVAHLVVKSTRGNRAVATATDHATLKEIHAGDRATCH